MAHLHKAPSLVWVSARGYNSLLNPLNVQADVVVAQYGIFRHSKVFTRDIILQVVQSEYHDWPLVGESVDEIEDIRPQPVPEVYRLLIGLAGGAVKVDVSLLVIPQCLRVSSSMPSTFSP